MKRPDLSRVPQFYHRYINLVPGDDLIGSLKQTATSTFELLTAIPDEKWDFRYAEDKWSIKEMVLHLADTERIFTYRALCIARGETASLPGFDEKDYAATSQADERTKQSLLAELKAVQQATILLFESFSEAQLEKTGTANNNPVSVRAIGFVTTGHLLHHRNVLQEKYLQ